LIIEEMLVVMNELKVRNQLIFTILAGRNVRSAFSISEDKRGAFQ